MAGFAFQHHSKKWLRLKSSKPTITAGSCTWLLIRRRRWVEAKDQPALHLLFYQITSKTLQYTWQNDPNSTLSLKDLQRT